jgi:hypothetical protein
MTAIIRWNLIREMIVKLFLPTCFFSQHPKFYALKPWKRVNGKTSCQEAKLIFFFLKRNLLSSSSMKTFNKHWRPYMITTRYQHNKSFIWFHNYRLVANERHRVNIELNNNNNIKEHKNSDYDWNACLRDLLTPLLVVVSHQLIKMPNCLQLLMQIKSTKEKYFTVCWLQ